MDNNGYNIDVHVNDKHMHYGDFAIGVACGATLIPAIYGVYTKVRKLIEIYRAEKNAKENEETNADI